MRGKELNDSFDESMSRPRGPVLMAWAVAVIIGLGLVGLLVIGTISLLSSL